MANYAKNLPRESGGEALVNQVPAVLAQARYASENSSASSVISVTENTTEIEVAAVGNAAVVKWITTSNTNPSVISAAGTANFDHVVPIGAFRRFIIPKETSGLATGASSISGLNTTNGLYRRVAIKSIGIASVLLSEY